MFEYFYHEIMRRTIISFGSIFNNVNIQHDNSDGSVVSTTKVPLAYGPCLLYTSDAADDLL